MITYARPQRQKPNYAEFLFRRMYGCVSFSRRGGGRHVSERGCRSSAFLRVAIDACTRQTPWNNLSWRCLPAPDPPINKGPNSRLGPPSIRPSQDTTHAADDAPVLCGQNCLCGRDARPGCIYENQTGPVNRLGRRQTGFPRLKLFFNCYKRNQRYIGPQSRGATNTRR